MGLAVLGTFQMRTNDAEKVGKVKECTDVSDAALMRINQTAEGEGLICVLSGFSVDITFPIVSACPFFLLSVSQSLIYHR